MKRMISGILAAALAVGSCIISPAVSQAAVGRADRVTVDLTQTQNWPAAPEIDAQCAYMIELNSGTVLYDKSGEETCYPASTTKSMTAYLALQNLPVDREVTFSHDAVTDIEIGGFHYEFKEGEVLSVDECLQFLMVESVNECAYALAQEISGTLDAFADKMNETAKEFGAVNTHFNNPHGLNDPDHYTTPRDMAMILWGCIQDQRFQQYASIRSISLKGRAVRTSGFQTYTNHHLMLLPSSNYYDADVVCGKTGFTSIAGSTLVTYAKRGDMDLVCVIMKGEDNARFADTRTLLDYAFDSFELVSVMDANKELPRLAGSTMDPGIEPVEDATFLVPKGTMKEHISSSFAFGVPDPESNVIGSRTWLYDGIPVLSSDMCLTEAAAANLAQKAAAQEAQAAADQEASRKATGYINQIVFILLGIVLLILSVLVIRIILGNIRRRKAAARRARLRQERLARERRMQAVERRIREEDEPERRSRTYRR